MRDSLTKSSAGCGWLEHQINWFMIAHGCIDSQQVIVGLGLLLLFLGDKVKKTKFTNKKLFTKPNQ